jgi:hypothetical protein
MLTYTSNLGDKMSKEEFLAGLALNFLLFLLLNIWLLWGWALLIATLVVWVGFFILEGDMLD